MIAQRCLTPDLLQEFVLACELLARRKTLQSSDFPLPETILRYGAIVGSVIQCHTSLERTMDQARRHIIELEEAGVSVASGTVILAETLLGSKGRFARTWYAPTGGLWGCIILADTFVTVARTLLPLTLGISCCEAVRELGVETASVRWVNDVMVGQQKLAGFLVEGFRSPVFGEPFHLLGFGININNECFPDTLVNTAVSLAHLLGKQVSLDDFTLSFLAKMIWNIGLLCCEEERVLHRASDSAEQGEDALNNHDDHLLLSRWKELSDTVGKRVLYGYDIQKKPLYMATVTGIRGDGGIVMRLDDGNQIVEHGGELRYV